MRGVATLVLVLVAALAWALRDTPRVPRAPAPAAWVASPSKPMPAFAVSLHALLHASDYAAALDSYALTATLAQRRRARAEIDAACRVPVLLRLDGRDEPDPRRDPARRELERRCHDWPVPSMYVPVSETDLPDDAPADAERGRRALDTLRTATRSEQLAQAWLLAYRHDALPQDAIFSDHRRLLPSEAENLFRVVLDWRECVRLDACGADGLFALRVCALHGCTPGSDVYAAWHQALAPRDYESVQAIHAWLRRWQLLAAR